MRPWNRFSRAFASLGLAVFLLCGGATLASLMAASAYVTFAPADRLRLALIGFLGRTALAFVALVVACGLGAWAALRARADADADD